MKHLIIDKCQDTSQKSKIHIIPFSLSPECQQFTDCKVSNYFQSTFCLQKQPQSQIMQMTSSIQGHKLVSNQFINQDNLYSCILYPKEQTSDIQMIILEKIENLTEWRKDIKWKKNQGHIGNAILQSQLLEVLHMEV